MSGKISGAMERAVKSWTRKVSVYSHAERHGITASALYRALVRLGKKQPVKRA